LNPYSIGELPCPHCGNRSLGSIEDAGWVCMTCRARIGVPKKRLASTCLIIGCLGWIAAIVAIWIDQPALCAVLAALSMALVFVSQVLVRAKPFVVSTGPYCRNCGYDLSKLPEATACPECGVVGHKWAGKQG
jgi:hypothetical protein